LERHLSCLERVLKLAVDEHLNETTYGVNGRTVTEDDDQNSVKPKERTIDWLHFAVANPGINSATQHHENSFALPHEI